jgi:hypothetical protein
MADRLCHWTTAIESHLADHGVTPAEFEQVVSDPDEQVFSDSSGLPAAIGWVNGRKLCCVVYPIDDLYIEPVTAYEIDS